MGFLGSLFRPSQPPPTSPAAQGFSPLAQAQLELLESETQLQLSPEEFELSAEEAFRRMTPVERHRLAHLLREQARAHDLPLPELLSREPLDERLQDSHALAQLVCEFHAAHPFLLQKLLGDAGFGGLRARLTPLPSERTVLDHPATQVALVGVIVLAVAQWLRVRRQRLTTAERRNLLRLALAHLR